MSAVGLLEAKAAGRDLLAIFRGVVHLTETSVSAGWFV